MTEAAHELHLDDRPIPAQEEARKLILAVLSTNEPPWEDDFLDDRVNLFLQCLWNGLSVTDAIPLSGWNASGYQDYLVRSGSSRSKQAQSPPDLKYARFATRVDQAMLSVKSRLVRTVLDAAIAGDVKAAQWALERRWPEEWGQRGAVPFELPTAGRGVSAVQLVLPDNQRAETTYDGAVTEGELLD